MSRSKAAAQDESGVDPLSMSIILMEDMIEKLKVLNYDNEFVNTVKVKPLSRHYFVIQTNPGEQFFMFTSLAVFLINKAGIILEYPQEYDDPNSTIASILDAIRQLEIDVDFPPNKLKQGHGQHVIYILDSLCNKILENIKYKWLKPQFPKEETIEEVIPEDDSEVLQEQIEDELMARDSDEDEENLLNIDDLYAVNNVPKAISKADEILESTTNFDDWKLELERVLPQLRVIIKTNAREWRSNLDQMKMYRDKTKDIMKAARPQLDKLRSDLVENLDKITSREKSLNSQLEQLLQEYRIAQDELARVTNRFQELSGGIEERQRQLSQATSALETVKQKIEDRSSCMTDGSPLVNLKKAISIVKGDIVSMDVKLGVLEHNLLKARLRDKTMSQNYVNADALFVS
nr:PREDICTED: intraflagellar transport protein 57 homolog [Bemisia tabaci]